MDYLELNKKSFLSIIKSYHTSDIYFLTGRGNTGDLLIYEGTRAVLSSLDISYKEIDIFDAVNNNGKLALMCGGGAWCSTYHEIMPSQLKVIERNFDNVIVLPSSYDISVDEVREALSGSKALFMAREMESYNEIKDICNAKLMHDHAMYFDYSKYIKQNNGNDILNAFRTDNEKNVSESFKIPDNNIDISSTMSSLTDWLNIISSYETIYTDRAHIMIAGAMLGKKVYYQSSNYHKVTEIAKFSLSELKVYPIE